MARIAILAFGSLIDDPGEKLHLRIREQIEGIKTPFSIEFARSSVPVVAVRPWFPSTTEVLP